MPVHGRNVSVLLVGHEPSLRDTYALLFQFEGYIAHAVPLHDLRSTLKGSAFRVVVMDHTLSAEERRVGVQIVRRLTPQTRTVALHSSAKDCGADLAMDSREGAEAILLAVRNSWMLANRALGSLSEAHRVSPTICGEANAAQPRVGGNPKTAKRIRGHLLPNVNRTLVVPTAK